MRNNSLAIPALRRKAMRYPDLPQPVLFHPLKHHLGYIREFIQAQANAADDFLSAQFKTIGSSQLDLYLGDLSIHQIAEETILYLQKYQCLEPEPYRLYLTTGGAGYGLTTLSDGSGWVLRWGVVEGRHVHLHPARYSRHTIRVKANLLKAAMAVSLAMKRTGIAEPDLSLVNQVRRQWLGLAPIPAFLTSDTLLRLIYLLGSK